MTNVLKDILKSISEMLFFIKRKKSLQIWTTAIVEQNFLHKTTDKKGASPTAMHPIVEIAVLITLQQPQDA